MDNASSIKLIKRRVSRGKKHVIKLVLVRFGGRDYKQTKQLAELRARDDFFSKCGKFDRFSTI